MHNPRARIGTLAPNFLPWSGTKNYLGFNKTTAANLFLYADFSPLSLALEAAGLGNGWNACAMSYGTDQLPTNLDVWSPPGSTHCASMLASSGLARALSAGPMPAVTSARMARSG